MTAAPSKKVYTPIMEIPHAVIGRCAQILPNKLQCGRAGDFQVLEASQPNSLVYQLCKTHVTLQKLADRLAVEKLAPGQALQEPEAADLPASPTTIEALNRLESAEYDPKAVYQPVIVVQDQTSPEPKAPEPQVKQESAKQKR